MAWFPKQLTAVLTVLLAVPVLALNMRSSKAKDSAAPVPRITVEATGDHSAQLQSGQMSTASQQVMVDGVPAEVAVSVTVSLTGTSGGSGESPWALVSKERLLPARESLHDAFNCYNKDGNHIVHGETEVSGLHHDITRLLSNDAALAQELIEQAEFRGADGLDVVEFGALIDLVCWQLNIEICTVTERGRHLHCKGEGFGALEMQGVGTPGAAVLSSAHADLHAAFECCDLDGDGNLCPEEVQQLEQHLMSSLHFANVDVARLLAEVPNRSRSGGDKVFDELSLDCLLMLLDEALEQSTLHLGA